MAGDVPIRMFSTSCSHADALLLSVLQYEVARQVPYAGDMMARITADQLTQHLTASGFVVMKGGAQRDKRSLFVPGSVRLWAFGLCGGTESGERFGLFGETCAGLSAETFGLFGDCRWTLSVCLQRAILALSVC
jgi:hypothetical protein